MEWQNASGRDLFEEGCVKDAAILEKRKLLVLGAVSSFVFIPVLCIERESASVRF